MRFWEWYQRVVLSIIALSLVMIVLRFYAPPGFTSFLERQRILGVPVYVWGGSVGIDGEVEVRTSVFPLEVEITNTPLEVTGSVSVDGEVEISNVPLEVEIVR